MHEKVRQPFVPTQRATIRILVVEDNPGDVELVRVALTEEEAGRFDVDDVDTLSAALARVDASPLPDVVLLDLTLPDASGLDGLLRLVQAIPQTPILVLTGADRSQGDAAIQAGAEDYLLKGEVSAALLPRAIRWAIERHQHAARAQLLAAEQAARASAETMSEELKILAELLRLSHDAVFVWRFDRGIEFWNEGAAALYGHSSEEARGIMPSSLLRTEFPASRADIDEALAREGAWYGELVHRCRDGRTVTVSARLQRILGSDGAVRILETNRDITDRRRAEEALRESADRLRTIVDTIPVGMLIFDAAGRVELVNDEAKRTWAGPGRLECVADYGRYKGVWADTRQPLGPEDWPAAQATLHGRSVNGVLIEIERFDGSKGTILASSAPLRDRRGRIAGGVAVNQDVTELQQAKAQLEQAHRRKDEFLGMLSHELRNPLAPIRNALYILEHVDANGPQARNAKDIASRQVAHLTRLVDDLLDVTRISRGKIELRHEDVDLAVLASRAAEDYRHVMQDRALELALELPHVAVTVNGDAARLSQVLGNLLSNAAKFTPASGRVTLAVAAHEGQAAIRVRDTGPGIAADVLPTIFEPFTQAKQTLARSEGGLGLGLALVKGLVALHGGHVEAYSGRGEGTEFVVTLPLARARRARPRPQRVRRAAATPQARRVLVIDDNRDAAHTVAELIGMLGHDVDVAYDAFDGLAKASEFVPDVVLCDLGLPGMDGYEFARQFRARTGHRHVRLVALSGYAQPEDVARATEAGFDAHVAKPSDPDRIAFAIGAAR